jgi:hypothetical protein
VLSSFQSRPLDPAHRLGHGRDNFPKGKIDMKRIILVIALFAGAALGYADEGMWTYNHFPSDQVKQKYGFSPDDKWLEHARLSSARISQGCSASFVSDSGLVMTNHHCARSCIQQLSTPQHDMIAQGFYAKNQGDEVKCPEMEINQLVEITDVTPRINTATAGLSGKAYNDAEKAESSRIEKACAGSDGVRCDVVSLYHGGAYNLYKYKRYQDVRLVFAPEESIAFFGGDPDNFMFPRYDLDVSFVRVYDGGKPAHMDSFLRWSPGGVKDGDLTFVSGHPGGTSRQLTVAQLEAEREWNLPRSLIRLAEMRGMITEYQKRGAEEKRHSNAMLFGIENSFKAFTGRLEALQDKDFFASKVADEKALRAKIEADPALKAKYGSAWDALAKAEADEHQIQYPLEFEEGGAGFSSTYFMIAKNLVRAADERPKPLEKRFREFRDSNIPAITQRLMSPAPIYDELETTRLTWSLTKLREKLGADHPFVKKVLGKQSPEELAKSLIAHTKLKDVTYRKQLWDGGKQAVDASDDAFIKLAKLVDPDGRAIRKQYEDNIESVVKKNSEAVAKARFAVEGMNNYPDATFTLRLSYGTVKGYPENGRTISPLTNFAGAFDRATGRDPFALPQTWIAARGKLNMKTPFDFCTTNDIIGGNSGSPVINQKGEVVGLIFDGNIQSLGGDYGFDAKVNRAVAVHSEALIQALDKIYGAERIVNELRPQHRASR